MSFEARARSALQALEAAGLRRHPRRVDSPQAPEFLLEGRSVLNLCSNDYLGLANHPALKEAAHASIDRWGCGSGASRHITGNLAVHRDAERALAAHVGLPAALLFSTGYAANVGTLQAVAGPDTVVFSDAYNHASLIDGCRLSRAQVHVYPHRDLDALTQLLAAHRQDAPEAFVITDALFSMDGTVAPLAALRALCDRHGAALLVDEAHSLGVRGPDGRGLCAEMDVRPDLLIGTLGKAFGAAGAFVAGAAAPIELVENRARSYVFSTAPPPSLSAVAQAALLHVQHDSAARGRLLHHAAHLRRGLSELGFELGPEPSHIVPVLIGDPTRTMELSARLLDSGVFVHGIRPPTVPPGTARLRVTPTAAHTTEQIERALRAFAALA